jgi:hypothetical protein
MFDLLFCRFSDNAESGKRPGLVSLHALGIANNIRRHDGGEAVSGVFVLSH